MTTEEKQLYIKLQEFFETNLPPGTAVTINDEHPLWLNIVCDGAEEWTAYRCVLGPGHHGQCYSQTKSLFFDRTN